MFLAFQPVSGLLWRLWICAVCFFDSNDLNSCCCWHSSISPFLGLSPSGDWGDILYYAISGRLRSLGLQLLFLFRTRPWLPLPFQQLCSPRPILIWQSHQACFLEDAISSPSTHGVGALCSGSTCRVIDQVCSMLLGSPSPWSPYAAGHWPMQKHSFFPTPNQLHLPPIILPALQRTHIPTLHLYNAFRHTLKAKLNTVRCTTAKGGKKQNLRTPHRQQIYFIRMLPIKQNSQNKNAVYMFALYRTLIPFFLFQIHPHKSVHKNRQI